MGGGLGAPRRILHEKRILAGVSTKPPKTAAIFPFKKIAWVLSSSFVIFHCMNHAISICGQKHQNITAHYGWWATNR